MQQTTCKLKMAKCNWNVIKLDDSYNVWGWKRIRFLLVEAHEQVDKFGFFSINGVNIRNLEWIKIRWWHDFAICGISLSRHCHQSSWKECCCLWNKKWRFGTFSRWPLASTQSLNVNMCFLAFFVMIKLLPPYCKNVKLHC